MFIAPPGITFIITDSLTADPGAVQAGATPLIAGNMNNITNAPATGSVLLPPAVGGGKCTAVTNVSNIDSVGNTCIVFPRPGERISSNAPNAGQNITLGRSQYYVDIRPGVWSGPLTA